MQTIISLLRGINVGGNKRVRMADLKALYADLGFQDTQTLLQSGNAVFKTDETSFEQLSTRIESAIVERFGFESRIILRTTDDLRAIAQHAPFSAGQREEGGKALVIFCTSAPDADAIKRLTDAHKGVEIIHVIGREVYVFYPDGMGRSKLSATVIEKALDTTGTGRNWNTIQKLMTLVDEMDAE